MSNRNKKPVPMYRQIPCKTCGTIIVPRSSREKHCSLRCRFIEILHPFEGTAGCWEWPLSCQPSGYGQIAERAGHPVTAHRLSYMTFKGAIPDGLFVCHTCDNRKCVNPDHLFVGTAAENVQDMVEKGRVSKTRVPQSGSAHWMKRRPECIQSKLTADQKAYAVLMSNELSLREIARRLGCTHPTIARAVRSLQKSSTAVP